MTKNTNHKDFLDYTKKIVNHPNYADLPGKKNPEGHITWVRIEKPSPVRSLWWDNKIKLLKVNSRADVARLIHPKELSGFKPCSICGKKLSIFYIYPNANILKKLNQMSDHKFAPYDKDIYEIIDILFSENNEFIHKIKNIFKINSDSNDVTYIKDQIKKTHTDQNKKGTLSCGVMSNAPDRLDGFHTYNSCCRAVKDKGRHKSNMSSYSRDRRAYEFWSDGDFVLANNMMGQFHSYKKDFKCPEPKCKNIGKPSPDHVGPISLGFIHRPHFRPMCSACNSKKNNRMTLSDIKSLLEDEKKGIPVVSWHSKFLWDRLKNKVDTNEKSKILSRLMRKNMHHTLSLFAYINELKNGYDFLKKFLNTDYCNNKYKFINFSPENTGNLKIVKNKLEASQCHKDNPNDTIILKSYSNAKTKEKSKNDYIRISFEALKEYAKKENRKISLKFLEIYKKERKDLYLLISEGLNREGLEKLKSVLNLISSKLESEFK